MDSKNLIEELTAEEKMRQGNVSLILDSYNDIFSDFDPRSYSERALSDDFLIECKRAARDKDPKMNFELRLLVPKTRRNTNDELIIKHRLKSHFQKHFKENQNEIRKIKFEGIVWFFIGVTLIIFAAIVEYFNTSNRFIFIVLFVILEPAGWFTAWSGLDKIFIEPRSKKPDIDFYGKMANAEVKFFSY